MDELKCRKRVLRRLGYANASDAIELKGRVACEISAADELLLTELLFNGVFNDLEVAQVINFSLLGCKGNSKKVKESSVVGTLSSISILV